MQTEQTGGLPVPIPLDLGMHESLSLAWLKLSSECLLHLG